VIPVEGGYLLEVVVHKELEDLDKPEHATAGGSTIRHDGTNIRQEGAPGRGSFTLGWIPLGRDVTLEQRMLADLHARLDLGGHPVHLPAIAPEAREVQSPIEELPPPGSEALPFSGPELLPPQ
jgi:hypothetical protein